MVEAVHVLLVNLNLMTSIQAKNKHLFKEVLCIVDLSQKKETQFIGIMTLSSLQCCYYARLDHITIGTNKTV